VKLPGKDYYTGWLAKAVIQIARIIGYDDSVARAIREGRFEKKEFLVFFVAVLFAFWEFLVTIFWS